MANLIPKFLRIFIVFSIILVWVFYGHPKIWPPENFENQSVEIPPKVEEAQALSVSAGDALIIYSNTTTTTPSWRSYTNSSNSFGTASGTVVGDVGLEFVMRTSPTKQEAIVAYVTSTSLSVLCFDGTTWSSEWTDSVPSPTGQRIPFDVAYESSSGDVMVLHSNGATSTNEMSYRTKSGTTGCGSANWSSATALDTTNVAGTYPISWVRLVGDRRSTSTLIAAIWADYNRQLSSQVWSGTAWGNEPSAALETNLEAGTGCTVSNNCTRYTQFDLEYESGGDLMVVWANSAGGNGTNGAYYATCTGGTSTCAWSATSTITSLLDDAHNLDISANPNTDEIVFASIGLAGSDLQAAYWSGSTWTGSANLDITAQTPSPGIQKVATGWLISGATTRSVIVYADIAPFATSTAYAIGNGATFTTSTPFRQSPDYNATHYWYNIQMDPINKDRLMFTISDVLSDLFTKRLVMDATPTFTWTNADGSSALEDNLSAAVLSPFSFAYWNFIPSTASTISCSTDISTTAFGVLVSDTISTSTPNSSTTMSCSNTSSGCSLKIYDNGNGGGAAGLFDSVSAFIESPDAAFNATATLTVGTEGYGIQATTTAVGSGGSLTIAERYIQKPDQVNLVGGLKLKATPVTIASSTADITTREVVVTHKAAVSSTTPGGTYYDQITYDCYVN